MDSRLSNLPATLQTVGEGFKFVPLAHGCQLCLFGPGGGVCQAQPCLLQDLLDPPQVSLRQLSEGGDPGSLQHAVDLRANPFQDGQVVRHGRATGDLAVPEDRRERERVEGFLALDAGAAPILAPEAGTLVELMVREGDTVAAGSPIARLSLERGTASGATSAELIQRELSMRVANLEAEKESVRLLAEQQKEQLRRRIDDLKKEMAQVDAEIRLQNTRVASAREDFQRTQQLVKEGFVSDTALTAKRNEQIDQQSKLEGLRRSRTGIERDLRAAQADLPSVDLRARQQIDQLSREKGELQQSLVQEEARRETVIRAPIAGVVTNIAVSRGGGAARGDRAAHGRPRGVRPAADCGACPHGHPTASDRFHRCDMEPPAILTSQPKRKEPIAHGDDQGIESP